MLVYNNYLSDDVPTPTYMGQVLNMQQLQYYHQVSSIDGSKEHLVKKVTGNQFWLVYRHIEMM